MSTAMTKTDVSKAAFELKVMRGALMSWLQKRAFNDQMGVQVPGRAASEQGLADKLHALLQVVMPDAMLPNADVRSNPLAAAQLAQIAITGQVPVQQSSAALGNLGVGATMPWLWPVLIVGGLLLAVVTAIRTAADVAKDAEEKACIQAGACTDYGFWLKVGGVLAIGTFAWRELGVGDVVKGFIKKGGR